MTTFASAAIATLSPPLNSAKVFVVDDDPDVRRAVSLLVRSVDLSVEVFASPQQFLEEYDSQQSGCLVLDLRMPGMTGLQLQQALRRRGIQLPIIFISAHGEIPLVTEAMRAGAVDFLAKPFSPHALLERIHEALDICERQQRIWKNRQDVNSRLSKLTEREHEVMQMLIKGDSTKAIANSLKISPKTVDNHRGKILDKMGVDNPTQLAHVVTDQDLQ